MSQDLQTAVIAACTAHKEQNARNADYRARAVHIGTDYFVKYGARRDLEPELATQKYIFAHAQRSTTDADAPRIARIVHHFVDQGTMYVVMEHIALQDSPPDLDVRIHKAMKWLSEVPPLSGQPLGPVGGGRIHHKFFKEYKAPFVFPDVATLDQYVNKAYGVLSHRAQQVVAPVSIRDDRVMFTQSDMDDANFGVDEHGRTVLMHFSAIGLLPETFIAQTLSADAKHGALAASLGVAGNANRASMAAITQCLWMVGDPQLGMEMGQRKQLGGV